ncbi:MAG: ArsA family ATPase [Mycobacterium sp.]
MEIGDIPADGAGSGARARIGFFVGKGGVGKSTLACGTAVRAALSGDRVLVVSTDQAHSLGDVLGVPVPASGRREPVRIFTEEETSGGGHLEALALDTLALLENRWRDIAPILAMRYPSSDFKDLAPEELSALPGVQEVLGLHEVSELAASGRWDYLVVDCASTADALRMLTMPGTFGMYLERAWPRHRRLGSAAGDVASIAVVAVVESLAMSLEGLAELLADGDRVGAHLVLTPERVVAAEAVRTLGSLALMGVRVAELIVNQVLVQDDSFEYQNLPAHPAFDWYSERIVEQRAVLDGLARTIGDVQLVLAPHLAGEPIGPKALGQLLDSVLRRDGSKPPGPLRPVVDRESGSGLDAIYRMRLELPQVDSGALALGRVDDDLIIGVAGLRRRVRLASVLRRCTVMDAALRGNELTIRFRPDPEVWPA